MKSKQMLLSCESNKFESIFVWLDPKVSIQIIEDENCYQQTVFFIQTTS